MRRRLLIVVLFVFAVLPFSGCFFFLGELSEDVRECKVEVDNQSKSAVNVSFSGSNRGNNFDFSEVNVEVPKKTKVKKSVYADLASILTCKVSGGKKDMASKPITIHEGGNQIKATITDSSEGHITISFAP